MAARVTACDPYCELPRTWASLPAVDALGSGRFSSGAVMTMLGGGQRNRRYVEAPNDLHLFLRLGQILVAGCCCFPTAQRGGRGEDGGGDGDQGAEPSLIGAAITKTPFGALFAVRPASTAVCAALVAVTLAPIPTCGFLVGRLSGIALTWHRTAGIPVPRSARFRSGFNDVGRAVLPGANPMQP